MTRRLIGGLIIGVTGVAILVALGVWQLQRLEWKLGVLQSIEARISGPSAPLPSMPDPEADKYQPLMLDGTIEAGELHVLVSRKHVGAGYLVIAPFVTDTGRRVLLDRGFIRLEDKEIARVAGPVTVSGNLHWPDDRTSSTPENDVAANIWFARDVGEMAAALNTEPILVVARDVSPSDPSLTPLPVDTSGIPNDHLQYAITWFSLAAVWLLMTILYIRRGRRQESEVT